MSRAFSSDDVAFLRSARGVRLLEHLRNEDLSERALLSLMPRLRNDYTVDETSAAIETMRLRERASAKFGTDAAVMLFTDDALQQASHPLVRRWRAAGWEGATVDVCCSIGTDSLAFARAGHDITGIDIDAVRVAMAAHNAEVLGLKARFVVRDATEGDLPPGEALFYDPARRDERGKRLFDVERYIPPLSLVKRWQHGYQRIAVKLAPGVDMAQLADYGGTVSFVSVDGELKEAELRLGEPGRPRAVLLSDSVTLVYCPAVDAPLADIAEPGDWLCEPDPAVIRAGYVSQLAASLGGDMLDTQIAYFTTERRPASPWVRAWKVLDWMPFHLKRLRAYLRERKVGTVTVKKRGSPITPEDLSRKLKLRGDESRTLVLTRLRDEPVVLICADYVP